MSIISETNNFGGPSFCSKYFIFYVDCGNPEKNRQNLLCFWGNSIWTVTLNTPFYWERILALRVNMLTNSLKISDTSKTIVLELILFHSDKKKMTEILPCRFKRSFGPFNMLTVHKFSDKRLFQHLSNSGFCSL